MATTLDKHFDVRKTLQNQAIPRRNQVRNNAGGYGWEVDRWQQFRRFLILGTEGGTAYQGERVLTVENAQSVIACIQEDGVRAVNEIITISTEGRAPKNDYALFALMLATVYGDEETRRAAYTAHGRVARTATHNFQTIAYREALGGWGRGMRRCISRWYNNKAPEQLAIQLIKYRNRAGWTHKDVLKMAHPKPPTPAHDALYRWVTRGVVSDDLPSIVHAYLELQSAKDVATAARLVRQYELPMEAVPNDLKPYREVWAAALPHMGATALVRNLANMTRYGLLTPFSETERFVLDRLRDGEWLRRQRIHPITILAATRTYALGRGDRGRNQWTPSANVVTALDDAFYGTIPFVPSTGKRIIECIDVSSSMVVPISGIPGLTARDVAMAMALITARRESNALITAFSHKMVPVTITDRMRLDDVIHTMARIPMGGTDCALPMLYALGYEPNPWPCRSRYRRVRNEIIQADAFIIRTDNETWYGNIHPAQALEQYHKEAGISAKLVVSAMTATSFTIADPKNPLMLDVVGFDTTTPQMIAEFISAM